MKAPLLIQVDLLGGTDRPVRSHWLPMLAELEQGGRPLVLLAERPDRWTPTRSRVDRAFSRQAEIEADLRRAGGNLDAVLYLDVGLFGRKSQYQRNLADLANRYGAKLEDIRAITAPGRIGDALEDVIGSVRRIENDEQLEGALKTAGSESA